MKRIALIMDGWKRFFTYAWPAGILQRIRETGEEVNLYIFNSSGSWSLDDDFNMGEYNIYTLPDLNDFDGIVLDLNNIRYPKVREYVIAAARKTNRPVISVANEIGDFYYAGINNYAAIQEIIAHLHKVHSCQSFWFAMGPAENYENSRRIQALQDYMRDEGIPFSEQDFYCESYEFKCGCNGFEQLLHTHNGVLPDAVICASDNIAVGVCETAEKHGFHVPKDFLITGFDNFDKASFYSPRITTVSHIREEVGYLCADIFLKLWNGQKVPQFNYTKTSCIFWDSCGCQTELSVDHLSHAKGQIMYEIETNEFQEQVLSMEYELMHCSTVREMTTKIPDCVPAMKCDAIYLLLDEHMNDFRKQKEGFDWHMLEQEEFHTSGYPEKLNVEFAYENGAVKNTEGSVIESLFPLFDCEKGGTDYLFIPLHFREKAVGALVIRNAIYLMEKQYLFEIVNVLTSAMENLHKKERLEYMNQMLSGLYVRDAMTGLYNRMGLERLAVPLFERKKKKKENLLITFIDMDRLKYINDNFGHEHGDFAIKTISQAIHHHCPKESIPVRVGGDEFLIIQKQNKETEVTQMIGQIRQEIQQAAKEHELPYPLTISVGCICTDMEKDLTLDDYVREADEVMYEEKQRKKANRTND